MKLEKIYIDSTGKECNILKMLKREPIWAANILQRGVDAIEALEEYQRFNRIKNDFDAYLFAMGEWALMGKEKPKHRDFFRQKREDWQVKTLAQGMLRSL